MLGLLKIMFSVLESLYFFDYPRKIVLHFLKRRRGPSTEAFLSLEDQANSTKQLGVEIFSATFILRAVGTH